MLNSDLSYVLKEHAAWMKEGSHAAPGLPDTPANWCFDGEVLQDRWRGVRARVYVCVCVRTRVGARVRVRVTCPAEVPQRSRGYDIR